MNTFERGPQPHGNPEELRKTKYYERFAMEHLYPLRSIFREGGILGHGEENVEWRNVSEHSMVAATVADVLAEHLSADRKVTTAALLHDWYKRREVETGAAEGDDYWTVYERDQEILKKLLIEKAGFDTDQATEMVELSHANFPRKEWVDRQPDGSLRVNPTRSLEEKIMHLVDEIVMDTEVVPFSERIGQQASTERGKKFYNSFQSYFGIPLDQIHLALCEQDQSEFEERLGLDNGALIDFIKNQLTERIEKSKS